jgi:hypothetical protein
MRVEVRWSWKGHAGLALVVLLLAGSSLYSFTTPYAPSPRVGVLAAVAAGVVALLEIPLAWYRLVADTQGLSVRSLLRRRQVAWQDVQKVEFIGQTRVSGEIVRWASTPQEAFHVVIHARGQRFSLHRWMTGIDDLVVLLAAVAVIDRDDPDIASAFEPTAASWTLRRAHDGLELLYLVGLGLPISWLLGVMVVVVNDLRLSGNPWLDGTVVALLPWGLAFGVYALVRRVRAARFGPEQARPPIGVKDAILTVGAAVGGPALLWEFVPRLLESLDPVDGLIVAAGLFCCQVPLRQVYTWLRYP